MIDDVSLFQIKKKVLEDLPVSKEIPPRKKTRPASSRKNSVGKIVSQHHILKEKENNQNMPVSKMKGK